MKKISIRSLQREGSIWFAFLCLLLSFLIVWTSFFLNKQNQLDVLSRGLYDVDPLTFTIKDSEQTIQWGELDLPGSFTVFVDFDPFYGFFYRNHTYVPPMVSGRFFREDDFYRNKKLAVIGKSVDSPLIDELKDEGFEIIGVMGATYSSKIDEMILLNLDAIEQGKPIDSAVYVMNYDHNSEIDALSFQKQTVAINRIDSGKSGVQRYLNTYFYQLLLLCILIVILVGFCVLFTYYWLGKKRVEIRVLWQLGVPMQHVFRNYRFHLFLTVTICFGVVSLGSYLWMGMHDSHLYHLLVGYSLLILSTGFTIGLFKRECFKQLKRTGGKDV
jgi:hypothetical protein